MGKTCFRSELNRTFLNTKYRVRLSTYELCSSQHGIGYLQTWTLSLTTMLEKSDLQKLKSSIARDRAGWNLVRSKSICSRFRINNETNVQRKKASHLVKPLSLPTPHHCQNESRYQEYHIKQPSLGSYLLYFAHSNASSPIHPSGAAIHH